MNKPLVAFFVFCLVAFFLFISTRPTTPDGLPQGPVAAIPSATVDASPAASTFPVQPVNEEQPVTTPETVQTAPSQGGSYAYSSDEARFTDDDFPDGGAFPEELESEASLDSLIEAPPGGPQDSEEFSDFAQQEGGAIPDEEVQDAQADAPDIPPGGV